MLALIVLAAGFGKRMGSKEPKVIARTREMPLIQHVLSAALPLKPQKAVLVLGHGKERVEAVIKDGVKTGLYEESSVSYALQEQQLGTGHAARCALPALEGFSGTVLILCGDTPLLRQETLQTFLDFHAKEKATVSVMTFVASPTTAYGRIVRNEKREVVKITEAKDCTPEELQIQEMNAGIYAVDSSFLPMALKKLENKNAQKEFYLTDIIAHAAQEGQTVCGYLVSNPQEVEGVNTPVDLLTINEALRNRRIEALALQGVIFEDPRTAIIDASAAIAANVRIGPNVQILGKTKIDAGVIIEGTAYIKDSSIGAQSHIKIGVRMENAQVGCGVAIGPFAHIRPETVLGDEVRIGNFVETKKAKLAKGAKANHLTYLGDCEVGEESNIGAGTITCNYDGYKKYETKIGSNVFIGSNTAIVAPVTVENGASIGAGSVITKDVAQDSLVLTRAPLLTKAGWAKMKREKAGKFFPK